MRKKIQNNFVPVPNKLKFLFFPRFCEGCLTMFWLEKILFKYDSWWSPVGCPYCGGFLWIDKPTALKYYNQKIK